MRKLIFLIGMIAILGISCEESDPTYLQETLNGAWKSVEKDKSGCTVEFIFSSTEMEREVTYDNTTLSMKSENYSLDEKTISVNFGGIKTIYEIEELTDERLTLTSNTLGLEEKLTYVRVQ